jgi:hypothetical protein
MVGSQAAEQGDCSKFVGDIPHSYKKDPTIVDLLPSAPYSQRVLHCCKGGSLSSSLQDFSNSVAGFKITVGRVEASKKIVKLPQHFKLEAPGPGYSCGPAKIVQPTQFVKPGTTRVLQAHSKLTKSYNVLSMFM